MYEGAKGSCLMTHLRKIYEPALLVVATIAVGYGAGLAHVWVSRSEDSMGGHIEKGALTERDWNEHLSPGKQSAGVQKPRGAPAQTDGVDFGTRQSVLPSSATSPEKGRREYAAWMEEKSRVKRERALSLSPLQRQKLKEIEALAANYEFAANDVMELANKMRVGSIFAKDRDYEGTAGIVRLWREGKWEDALEIAEKRLAVKPDDLPGLFIKAAYAQETADIDTYLDTGKTILQVVVTVNTPAVKAILPDVVWNLPRQATRLGPENPAFLEMFRDPSRRPRVYSFINEPWLKACESDGLF